MALASGTYYIFSPGLRTYLEFHDSGIGVNLTSWQFSGSKSQQWEISSTNFSTFTFKNSASKMYTVWDGKRSNIVSGVSPMDWAIKQTSANGTYVISPYLTFTDIWDVEFVSQTDNSPVIVYAAKTDGNLNQLWGFTPVPPESSTKKGNVPVIAGAVVGGAAGLALLVLAFLQSHNLAYLLGSLAFTLFGWWLFRGRRIVLFSEIGPVQITFFLSPHDVIRDSAHGAKETVLVWQVANIGHSRKGSSIFCPSIRGSDEGKTKLGFSTVIDDGGLIKPGDLAPAPAIWNGNEWTEFENPNSTMRNDNTMEVTITVGTYEEGKNDPIFRPFLRVKDVLSKETYQAQTNLYLHAFLTNGYSDGQYGEELVEAVRGDMLTRRGISLADLKPITHWRVRRGTDGKLKLDIKGGKDQHSD